MPTFLIKTLNRNEDYDFNEIEVPQTLLDNFDIDDLQSETLLFQAGYLTIKEQYDTIFTLIYPNKEVKQSLLDSILSNKTNERRRNFKRNSWRKCSF